MSRKGGSQSVSPQSRSLPGKTSSNNADATALEKYHASLISDPTAESRCSAFAARRQALSGLGGRCSQAGLGPSTWDKVEQTVEAEVSFLQAIFEGTASAWSPGFCERLRAHCLAQGTFADLATRPRQKSTSAFLGEIPMFACFDSLALLGTSQLLPSGTPANGALRAQTWMYQFSTPQAAAAHLVSHPAFGILPAKISATCRSRTACIVFSPPTLQLCEGGIPPVGYAVVSVLWRRGMSHIPAEVALVGSDLQASVDGRIVSAITRAPCGTALPKLWDIADDLMFVRTACDKPEESKSMLRNLLLKISEVSATLPTLEADTVQPAQATVTNRSRRSQSGSPRVQPRVPSASPKRSNHPRFQCRLEDLSSEASSYSNSPRNSPKAAVERPSFSTGLAPRKGPGMSTPRLRTDGYPRRGPSSKRK